MNLLIRTHFRLQRGLTLTECLAYIAVLGILIAIGGSTVAKAWDKSRALSRNSQDIERAINAGERWRADIRAATGPVELASASNNRTLRIPTQTGRIEYEFTGTNVCRRANEQAGWVTVLPTVKDSQMQRGTDPGVSSWQWELELQPSQKTVRIRPLFTFTAVPGKEIAR